MMETLWGCSDWLAESNGAHYQQELVAKPEWVHSGPSLSTFSIGIYGGTQGYHGALRIRREWILINFKL